MAELFTALFFISGIVREKFLRKKKRRKTRPPPEIALKYPPVPYRVNNNPLLKAGGCLAQRI